MKDNQISDRMCEKAETLLSPLKDNTTLTRPSGAQPGFFKGGVTLCQSEGTPLKAIGLQSGSTFGAVVSALASLSGVA